MTSTRKHSPATNPRPHAGAQAAASIRAATRKIASVAEDDSARDAILKSDAFRLLDPAIRKIAEHLSPVLLAKLIKKAEKEAAKTPAQRVQEAPEDSSLAKMGAAFGVRSSRKKVGVNARGELTMPTRTPSEIRAAKARATKAKA